jgi:hypothetical protein
MSALLIGSFAPDFAYFFFLSTHGLFAHSLTGMFVLDLPLSLLGLWLFHAYIKQPGLVLLPKGFRARMKSREGSFTFWPPARLALVVVSILIGIATHLLWDSFTHPFYWPYHHWSFLAEMVHVPIEGNVEMYKALQNGSSLFGLAVVAVWIAVWYHGTKPVKTPIPHPYSRGQIRVIRTVVPAFALVGGLIKSHWDAGAPDVELRPVLHFAVIAGIAATTFLGIGLLICGLVFKKRAAVTEPV